MAAGRRSRRRRPGAASRRARWLERYGLFLFLALLIAFGALVSDNFLSAKNIQDVLTQAAPLGMVVVGQAFVLLVPGFDLSVASLMATGAVIGTALDATSDLMVPAIFGIGIAFSVAVYRGFAAPSTSASRSPTSIRRSIFSSPCSAARRFSRSARSRPPTMTSGPSAATAGFISGLPGASSSN